MDFHPDDMKLPVKFFTKPVEDENESRKQGRPIYRDVDHIEIGFPADKNRVFVAPASEVTYVTHYGRAMSYAERFAPIYQRFKEGLGDSVMGTPLAIAKIATPAQMAELSALKITTVEQLAGLPDRNIKALGWYGRELVGKAKAYLEKAQVSPEVLALQEQVAVLTAQLAAQQLPASKGNVTDEFSDFGDEDLANMLTDAGGDPAGKSRGQIVDGLREIAAAKAKGKAA